jgi:hypothetical protein
MTPAVILAFIALLGFCLGAVADQPEKPITITKALSPGAPELDPNPNWELKEEMGVVENPGSSVPDFDPNGKRGPKKGPAPPADLRSSVLTEDFEGGVVPPAGWGAVVNNPYTWEIDDYNPCGGIYNASCFYDESYTGTQDEWLTSPLLDFEGLSSDLKLEFCFMGSYYWSIDPYDNCDMMVWISTDGGATFPTMIWDETALGVWSSWVWYEVVVDLSSYVGEKDVVLGFQYYGYDGAQFSLDNISVNDDPAPVGRCCYGDPLSPSCDDVSAAVCAGLGGEWDGSLDCTEACPVPGPGDNCDAAAPLTLSSGTLPVTDNNYTCGRVDDYDGTCLGSYDGGEDIIYELTVLDAIDVDITLDPLGTTYTGMLVDDACPPDPSTCIATATNSGSSPYKIMGLHLEPGTYYMMIDTWPAPDCIPEYNLTFEASAGPTDGDNCEAPVVVKLPDDMPYMNTNYNCGRGDNYDATCLGSYDGGEDIIYELDVTGDIRIDITLDPKGTTWTGIAIGDACPLPDPCIATSTASSGGHEILGVSLSTGLYYIQIDTWPSPNCIPDFDLTITEAPEGPENDDCANATPIGEVENLPFTTMGAGNDGGGTCQGAPNVWYCYTATESGLATISLCGSAYDTKMAVYDGCGCGPLGAELGCDDDGCAKSLQSIIVMPVTGGNSYMIEVGGYGSNTGNGILNVSVDPGGEPPPNDNCSDVTPTTLTVGVTTTFNGNNEYATQDCFTLDAGATEAWEAFTLTEKMDIVIDYCGTTPSFELVYIVLADACPCGELIYAESTDWTLCSGDGNVTMYFPALDAGTYYIPVLAYHPSYPTGYYYAGDYTINVLGTEWVQDYCDASGGCDEYIENVTVADINNTSGCEGYGDFTAQIANMDVETGYPITITIGNAYSSDYGAVWVDWNQDYDFDDPDEKITLDVNYGYGPYTGTITPPATATAGETRMRVRLSYYSEPGPCGATSYGEAEDYTINVGGEQSELTIDPESIVFGPVPPDATGNTTLTLGAVGEANINFSIGVEYAKKNSVGGGTCDPTLRTSPFEGEGFMPAHEKDPNQLLFEGFEGTVPPAGWTLVQYNPVETWHVETYAPYEGVQYASCVYDATYTDIQDEWLITPALDFAGNKYILDFWWNGSYYWSVDPYNNCDLEIWLSVDGGASWLVKLWDENTVGEFTNWEWYNQVIDLSAFKDESNVAIGIRYYGWDGAQLSVDAFALNDAPLSWLSVNPSSGSIPGGIKGTLPVTVSYDAAGLELGTYEANLVITHNGLKGTDNVPVTLVVSSEIPLEIDPWPIYALYAYAMEPMVGHIYVRDDDLGDYPGYTVADIVPGEFLINEGDVPVTGIDFPAESFFDVSFDVKSFIDDYPLMWGTEDNPYTVSGMFDDMTPFILSRTVECIGHISGDANLDGNVNVGDAVFLISYVFRDGPAPRLEATADANCDGSVNVADAVRLVNFIFRNGAVPCHP